MSSRRPSNPLDAAEPLTPWALDLGDESAAVYIAMPRWLTYGHDTRL